MATIKSIEEKARRYDKALERANKLKETCDSNAVVGWMEYIFPELKESGDIRKRIIDALHGDVLEMGEIKKAIAWLEKQGNLMKALQISNARIGELIEKNYYLKEQLEKQGNNMGISETTKKELEDNLNKALEKETPESCNEFLDEQGSKKENLKERNICDTCEDSNGCLIPCCAKLLEKQGEQKMKTPEESIGVDSDTYNKIVDECIYGKQKPAEWHREDEQNLNACLGYIQDEFLRRWLTDIIHVKYDEPADLPKGEDYGIDGLYAAIDILQKTLGEVDGYQSDDGILTHKCAISAVKELSKQKPAWSEEDIELLDNTIKFIEDRVAATSPSLRTYSPTLTGKEIPFLKALKDRVQPQKQEWSDADKDILFRTIDNLKFLRDTISIDPKYSINIIDIEREITWLNSLKDRVQPQPKQEWSEEDYNEIETIACHLDNTDNEGLAEVLRNIRNKHYHIIPQSTWKPSDEQMEALEHFVRSIGESGYASPYDNDTKLLYSLLFDLKKLREK